MKPIYGIDVTTDKKNKIYSGSEFITKTNSAQQIESFNSKQEKLDKTIANSKLPTWLRIIEFFCGISFLIIIGVLIKASESFEEMLRNDLNLIIIGVISGLIALTLHFYATKKENKVLEEQNADQQFENINENIQNMYDSLNVPDTATSVDILLFRYIIKNDKIVVKSKMLPPTSHVNVEVKIYINDEYLCFADVENIFSFKLSELKAIRTINKRIIIPSWNKDSSPMHGEFKQYKLGVTYIGTIIVKPYHILEIERNGTLYGIYFPCYELATFEALTGLKAES